MWLNITVCLLLGIGVCSVLYTSQRVHVKRHFAVVLEGEHVCVIVSGLTQCFNVLLLLLLMQLIMIFPQLVCGGA